MPATIAELSMTWCPSQDMPHYSIACRTVYISLNCMSLSMKQWGHLVENHSLPKMPPRPLDPLASVYTCSVGFGRSKIWMPFQACTYDNHHHMSVYVYAGM